MEFQKSDIVNRIKNGYKQYGLSLKTLEILNAAKKNNHIKVEIELRTSLAKMASYSGPVAMNPGFLYQTLLVLELIV